MFPGDLLWHRRWEDILTLKPDFIEIVTWNDYGESHYIGPLNSKHTDDGGSKWVNDMYVLLTQALQGAPALLSSTLTSVTVQAARRLARYRQAVHRCVQGRCLVAFELHRLG